MKAFYLLEPEVPGEFGPNTILDTGVHPPRIKRLELLMKGWLGDCLMECFPAYILTSTATDVLKSHGLSGFTTKEMHIRSEYPFDEIQPDTDVPAVQWIEINGTAMESDFGLKDHVLVVSQEALNLLKAEGLQNCAIQRV